MIIGKIEIDLAELLSKKPPELRYRNRNPFAREDCDCRVCREIILRDAYFIWYDNDHIKTEEQLADAVSRMNWGDKPKISSWNVYKLDNEQT
jgi:hypothetical protein